MQKACFFAQVQHGAILKRRELQPLGFASDANIATIVHQL